MRQLPMKQKLFFCSIYMLTALIFIHSIYFKYIPLTFKYEDIGKILFFIILNILTESFMVTYRDISVSTTFAITLASYNYFGPLEATIIVAVGFLFRIMKDDDNTYYHVFNTPLYGTIFNICVLILPMFIGNYLYGICNGTFKEVNIANLISLINFSITYFLLNTFIVSILLSLHINKNVIYCFLGNIRLGILNYIAMIPLAILLIYVFINNSYTGVLLVFFPIALARYTFSLYIDSKSQYVQTVEALMNAIEARDQYTKGHSRRVAELSAELASVLGYNQKAIEQLNFAAMLHDVGKIGISDNILNKPGSLTDEEFNTIKKHPEIGHNILKDIKNIEKFSHIIRNHHERYDGKGYPDRKKEDELDLLVYIVQLADAVDAMATDRPYRKGLSQEYIIEEIEKYSGTQFHPKVAEAYLKIYKI